jgi:YidC/Oxa1 family membrane protein insertase
MIDKKVFLTVAVCFGIFLLWNTFVAIPPKAPPKKSAPVAASQPASAPAMMMAAAAAPASAPTLPTQHAGVASDKMKADWKNIGAALDGLQLKEYKEGGTTRAQEKHEVQLIPDFAGQPLEGTQFLLGGAPILLSDVSKDDKGVTMTGKEAGLAARAHWQLEALPYVMRLDVELENTTQAPQAVAAALRLSGVFNEKTLKNKGMFEPPPDLALPVAFADDKLFKHDQGKADSPPSSQKLMWAGIDRQYFLLAAAPLETHVAATRFDETPSLSDPMLKRMSATIEEAPRTLEPGKKTTYSYRVYGGPKASQLLAAAGQGFEEAIDYKVWFMPLGFLSRPMLWVLNHAYAVVHSYGLAILILTFIVKLLLLPVTQKSFVSMQMMKDLKPELDKIKERFPNDREKQGMETMKLYKDRGVSPFGGCLPALFQMPIYFALWRTLYAAVELYQQQFLWLGDLTAKDPYYILPVLLGITFFIQQKMSPPAGDPQQQKIMMFMMPPLMTLFMVQLSSGLVFYVLVNTILTIAQQAYIGRRFGKTPALSVGRG